VTRALDAFARPVPLELGGVRAAVLAGGAYAVASPFLPAVLHIRCPLRAGTGVPCPLCGITTAVGDALRLDVAGALHANPFGLVLTLLAIALLIRPARRMSVPLGLLVAGVAASWAFELVRFGIV
jgi:hypothetical protein